MNIRSSTFILSILLAVTLTVPTSPFAQSTQIPTLKQPEAASGALHYLTIPAAAFHPTAEVYDYQNHGRYLIYNGSSTGGTGSFYAPVQLPQGAHITKLTYFWKDPGPGYTIAQLWRSQRTTDTNEIVADTPPSQDTWTPGFGFSSEVSGNFTIDAPINNQSYNYYLAINLPEGGQIWGCAVQIEYTEPLATAKPDAIVDMIAVPPAAFTPFSDGHEYYNPGWYLWNYSGPTSLLGRGWYVAPVYLPEGVTVTGLIFQWKRNDTTSLTGTAVLERSALWTGSYDVMASVSSAAGSGALKSSSETHTISNGLVSDILYTYWVVLDLPNQSGYPSPVEARDVDVQYTVPSSSDHVLSVSAAAFQPFEDGYDYQNAGRSLTHYYGPNSSSADGWYLAPVNLPDGVLITRLDFYWYENTTVPGEAHLQRTALNAGDYQDLAIATTSTGSDSGGLSLDTSVIGGPVDNEHYAYWIVLVVPSTSFGINVVHPYSVRLYYNFPVYLPLVVR
jgi:hypothetical protein